MMIVDSELNGKDKTNKNVEKPWPDGLPSFTPITASVIDKIRNIKCKRPDTDAIYWYVSENVVTDVDKDFIETIVA